MAPCNQRRSTVSAIETRITSNDLGSVAPAAKIAKKKKGVRSNGKLHVDFDSSIREPIGRTCFTFFTAIGTIVTRHAPRNVRKWDDIPEEKIQALIDRVLSMFDVDISIPYVKDWVLWRMKLRFRCIKQERATQKAQNAEIMKLMSKLAIGSFDMDLEVDSTYFNMAPANQPPRSTSSATPAPKIAKKKKGVRSNVKLHVVFDSSVGEPRGCNCYTFFKAIGTIVSRHAPLNVGKWDDIPEEKIQSLIDRVLRKFDVDISKPYVQDWILWRMKFRFRCIMEDKAKEEAENAQVMELMSKLAIGSFDMDLEVDSTYARSKGRGFICVDAGGTYCGLAIANVISKQSAPIHYQGTLARNYPLSPLEGFFIGEPTLYPIQVFTCGPEMPYATLRDILNQAAADNNAYAFIFGFSADPRNWDTSGQYDFLRSLVRGLNEDGYLIPANVSFVDEMNSSNNAKDRLAALFPYLKKYRDFDDRYPMISRNLYNGVFNDIILDLNQFRKKLLDTYFAICFSEDYMEMASNGQLRVRGIAKLRKMQRFATNEVRFTHVIRGPAVPDVGGGEWIDVPARWREWRGQWRARRRRGLPRGPRGIGPR
ncbi:hypothetical protein LWI29_003370 [Acer saccharum]|uniref:Uncharacterized protein n=1 Tax=Acer saccharum TaxID=4024 RepID=A0AA39TNQ4_ACESA|nr:hypothetical protein LWI29_003370 [Acer saccharum]